MADTMPKQGQTGQSEVSSDENVPLPGWVGPVKVAVMVMSVLIAAGLVLLVYGLATGLNKKSPESGTITFQHPEGASLISVSAGAEGASMLHFRLQNGGDQIIILSPDGKKIQGRITLEKASDFGITQR